MKIKYHQFILIFCFSILGCVPGINNQSNNILPATALFPYGRYIVNERQNLELISSGVHFGFSFEGKQCEILVSLPNAESHNYLQYELDEVYQKRIRIDANDNQPILITAADTGKHTIWIYKATEAHTGAVIIEKIIGVNVKPLQRPALPLIEFIGNSITAAAASDASEVPCGTGEYHDQHNAYFSYGPRVARALRSEFILSAVSGVGIYRNWNSEGPSMPDIYEKADFFNPRPWNFKEYNPQVVSIALGTNDFSDGDGIKKRSAFDSLKFLTRYMEFVKIVISKYPQAQIALLSSPVIIGSRGQTLQNCLTEVKNNIDSLYPSHKPIAVYFFQPMKARGCTGHPSIEDHAILAEELLPFFKKLIN